MSCRFCGGISLFGGVCGSCQRFYKVGESCVACGRECGGRFCDRCVVEWRRRFS